MSTWGKVFPGRRYNKCKSLEPGVAVVLSPSRVQLFATLGTAAHQASLSFTICWSLFRLMSIDSVMPSNHLILSPLLLLPSVLPSIRVFSNESALWVRWPKYWSFSISPSNEYSELTFFRINWFASCCPRDSQESFLEPRFESIKSV